MIYMKSRSLLSIFVTPVVLIAAGQNSNGGLFWNTHTVQNPEFTVIGGGKAVFEGYDVLGHVNLWVTDGTAAGTSEIVAVGAKGKNLCHELGWPP